MTPEKFISFANDCASESRKVHEAADNETRRLLDMLSDNLTEIGVEIIGFSGNAERPEFHVYKNIEALAEYLGVTEFSFEVFGTDDYPWQKTFDYCGAKFFELRSTRE